MSFNSELICKILLFSFLTSSGSLSFIEFSISCLSINKSKAFWRVSPLNSWGIFALVSLTFLTASYFSFISARSASFLVLEASLDNISNWELKYASELFGFNFPDNILPAAFISATVWVLTLPATPNTAVLSNAWPAASPNWETANSPPEAAIWILSCITSVATSVKLVLAVLAPAFASPFIKFLNPFLSNDSDPKFAKSLKLCVAPNLSKAPAKVPPKTALAPDLFIKSLSL